MRCALVPLLALGCASALGEEPALRFDGMGDHRRPVTEHAQAQEYFDQGLALVYGFNHDEAARSFAYAARLDPGCAMAHWGEAFALGPNYRFAAPSPEANRRALAALARARDARATPVERGLLDALARRFADPQPPDPTPLNEAYAHAMGELWRKHPRDTDIGTLYAGALMDLQPWALWSKDGEPLRRAEEIVAVLERVLALDKNHPGANHLYIHAVEASPSPERAEAAADRLGSLVPGSGHLVHMPSHIYIRVGRYMDAIECNRRAATIDGAYFARARGAHRTYRFSNAHNNHFLAWSAMYAGRYEDAVLGSNRAAAAVPEAGRDTVAAAEYLTSIAHVYIRFGRWAELLALPPPPSRHPYARALHHYGRGVALANTERFDEARAEAAAFERHAAAVPRDDVFRGVPLRDLLGIARHMLAGETAFQSGDEDAGLGHLRRAVEMEDGLRYQEPSSWMMPARHALGALLLDAGEVEEAEAVYKKDLELHRENGWALHGLALCLERRGRTDEAAAMRARFDTAWADATVRIQASCFCARDAGRVVAK